MIDWELETDLPKSKPWVPSWESLYKTCPEPQRSCRTLRMICKSQSWAPRRNYLWPEDSSLCQDEIFSHLLNVTLRPIQVTRMQFEGMKHFTETSADYESLCFVFWAWIVHFEMWKRGRSNSPHRGTGVRNIPKSLIGLWCLLLTDDRFSESPMRWPACTFTLLSNNWCILQPHHNCVKSCTREIMRITDCRMKIIRQNEIHSAICCPYLFPCKDNRLQNISHSLSHGFSNTEDIALQSQLKCKWKVARFGFSKSDDIREQLQNSLTVFF